MIDRKTKLRFRRNVRKGKRQVEGIGIQAEDHLERLFIRRLHRLITVRRFVLSWLLLVVFLFGASVFQLRALSDHYLRSAPAEGGVFTEGVIGSFTNANPLYATGGVDGGVSRLLFSSLLKYDKEGELTNDLATSWKADENGEVYTVTLRQDAQWHDGNPVTVEDVVFTYKMIQDPNTQSPLFPGWRDVKIEAVNDEQIKFTLPNVFAAFPHSLTNGIIPEHILGEVSADQMRSDQFNTVRPVGSGPFEWEAVEVSGDNPEERQEQISLTRNEAYYDGAPKLRRFVVKTFREESVMLESYQDREIMAMSGLSNIPDTIESDGLSRYSVPQTGAVMVFFKTSEGVLQNKAVRQALTHAVDVNDVIEQLLEPVIRVDSPLLRGQLGYDEELTQREYDLKKARKILSENGWEKGEDGIMIKGERRLEFNLKAPSSSEFTIVSGKLQEYWRELGAEVTVDQPDDPELQSIVSLHQYEAVMYSVSIGKDPDVFAFWHSSQADVRAENRLNLSEYQSTEADQSLEGGRTRVNPKLRAVKYQPFLQAWRNDAPALALYQPQYLYVAREAIGSFDPQVLHDPNDRYGNVHDWTIKTRKIHKN
ncbi:MAG: peptide ABC transporter substrate-binding protein [Candidatus Saccharibacteria bacterium]|nr:peptide ABC transporter substrate-binding protein [Candidatus Saccharibacteria bacterium]